MHSREKSRPSGLEKTAKMFLSIPEYKDEKAQAQRCANEAESIRAGLYSDAVNAMNVAGAESSKWDIAKKKLSEYELNGYRDVETLRANAAKRFDECLAAERDAKQREEERLRQQAEAAAAKKKRITIAIVIASIMAIACLIVYTSIIVPDGHYKNGDNYFASRLWDQAIDEFEAAGSYKDASERIIETKYQKAVELLSTGRYDDAASIFASISGYKDANDQYKECIYQRASHYLASADYDAAYAEFMTITGYRDVDAQLSANINLRMAIGAMVSIGSFEQDGNASSTEPIEWVIIGREGTQYILLSRYVLRWDYMHYFNGDFGDGKRLINYVREEFLQSAFTQSERSNIRSITILSKEQIEKYLPNASERRTTSTVAAGGNGSWWTSTGIPSAITRTQYSGYAVSSSGSFIEVQGSMRLEKVSESRKKADDKGVRPAIFVNESDLIAIISTNP